MYFLIYAGPSLLVQHILFRFCLYFLIKIGFSIGTKMNGITKNTFNKIKIDFKNTYDNLKTIQNIVGPSITIMPIVKDNAYGHGLVEISRFLITKKVSCSYTRRELQHGF